MIFPRYAFIKGMTNELTGENEYEESLIPVLARLDDASQIVFEIERTSEGLVTVYVPGSPDPWSGTVMHMTADRITRLNAEFTSIIRAMRKAGSGASQILEGIEKGGNKA